MLNSYSSNLMETKKCSNCGEVKPINEFYKHKSRKDGLYSQCKCCANKKKEEYRKKHLKEIKEYHKQDLYDNFDLHDIADNTSKEEEINDYLYTKTYEYDDKDFDI